MVYPIIYRVSTIQGGAGFLPSTVGRCFLEHQNFGEFGKGTIRKIGISPCGKTGFDPRKCDFTCKYIPSGYVKIAMENDPVEIVDFPSYKMVDLSSSLC